MAKPSDTEGLALREWQRAALDAWTANDRRGIVAAATGTGKTRMAVAAIQSVGAGWRTIIVVPTKSLQTQWTETLASAFRLHPRRIGRVGGSQPRMSMDDTLVVSVLASARERVPAIAQHWLGQGNLVLLILDECHWGGSEATAQGLFAAPYSATLGLSATPERSDDGLDEYLVPALGSVVYRYSLRQALDDGMVSDLLVANLYVDLQGIEVLEYQRLAQLIDSAVREGRDPVALIAELRRLLEGSRGRAVALSSLVDAGLLAGRRTIIFHESIAQAESTSRVLRQHDHHHSLEHSKLDARSRKDALSAFANGASRTLVTVRALDEGIDVPAADTALIFSGSMNPRQRLQRAGRVLRPAGEPAQIISFLAAGTPEQTEVGDRDPLLFGADRVAEFREWTATDAPTIVQYLQEARE